MWFDFCFIKVLEVDWSVKNETAVQHFRIMLLNFHYNSLEYYIKLLVREIL